MVLHTSKSARKNHILILLLNDHLHIKCPGILQNSVYSSHSIQLYNGDCGLQFAPLALNMYVYKGFVYGHANNGQKLTFENIHFLYTKKIEFF